MWQEFLFDIKKRAALPFRDISKVIKTAEMGVKTRCSPSTNQQ